MRFSERWGEPFSFDDAYDRIGAPQDASAAELAEILGELGLALAELGPDEERDRAIEAAAQLLLDEELRAAHDQRARTRFLATQDIAHRFAPHREAIRRRLWRRFQSEQDGDLRAMSALRREASEARTSGDGASAARADRDSDARGEDL